MSMYIISGLVHMNDGGILDTRMKDRLCETSRRSSFHKLAFSLLDQFLSLFVVTPAAILVWRGAWLFFDEFLFPENATVSGIASLGIGYIFIMMSLSFMEMYGDSWKLKEKHREWRIFMYPLSIAVVHSWRGVWILLNIYFSKSELLFSSHFVSFLVLLATSTLSTTMFVPSYYANDCFAIPFEANTMFETGNTRCNPLYKLLDYLFTITVITMSTIAFWRSTWVALDIYAFPQHKTFSNVFSILIGYTIIVSIKIVESHLKTVLLNQSKAVKFVMQAVFCYAMAFATINVWRGIWQICDIFLLPDHTVLVAITSHYLGLLVLYLSRSVVNIVGCPFSISVDSLENLSAFDKTICGVTNFQRPNHGGQDSVFRRDVEKGDEMNSVKKLLVSTSSESERETTTTVVE